jgi:hypothetical protein
MPEGELLAFERVWELSKMWYRDRLSAGFTGRSFAEAHAIFAQLGLKPPFWHFDTEK